MTKKHYVIWKGAQTGVFDSWPTVKALTDGRADAQYMGFPNKEAAQQAFQGSYTKALMQRSLAKGKSAPASKSTPAAKSKPSGSSYAPIESAVDIYCDGACSPNPGKSGTGIAIYEESKLTQLWYGLHQAQGTNNTAELNGMLESFKLAKQFITNGKPVQVLCDSKYSIDCITKWAKGWQSKGWTRGKGEEIKNLEIIKECYALYLELKVNLTISHVKGHANIEGNELADRMAVYARTHKETKFVTYQHDINIKDILAMPSG